jgi:hypothetical protein
MVSLIYTDSCCIIQDNEFLSEILAILCITRKPIPYKILVEALYLEDNDPNIDIWGNKQFKYQRFSKRVIHGKQFLGAAIRDLQRFVKVVDDKGESYSFCKNAIREACAIFLKKSIIKSAQCRLGGLAFELISKMKEDDLEKMDSYMATELLYLFSLDSENEEKGLRVLFSMEFFPEWLQQRALMDEGAQWRSSFINDLTLFDGRSFSDSVRRKVTLVSETVKEWPCQLDSNRRIVAPFIRNKQELTGIWPPRSNPSELLVPLGGYSRRINRHIGIVCSLVGLHNGLLASGGWDCSIRIWNLNTGKSSPLERHLGSVRYLVVYPDGRLASGAFDGSIIIWDVETGESTIVDAGVGCELMEEVDEPSKEIYSLVAFPDGRLASTRGEGFIEIRLCP